MSAQLVSILPDETILSVAKMMKNNDLGSLVVLDPEGVLKGILTSKDFVNKVVADQLDVNVKVSQIMSTEIYTQTAEATMIDVGKTMYKHKIGCVIIMEEDKVCAMVTAGDLIELFSS